MTDTVKTVTTPMSRTSAKMGTLRRGLKAMGFKQVILNQSKGKVFNNDLRGKVSKDYVEFFSIPDVSKKSLETENVHFLKTFGFNYNYIDRDEGNHTVEINYQEKVSSYDETEKKFRNTVNVRLVSSEISIDTFQKHLSTILNKMEQGDFVIPEDFLNSVIEILDLKPEVK